MDVIINLFILFIIVVSVLRSLQDAARKSREIKIPPPKPVEMRPEPLSEAAPEREPEWAPEPQAPSRPAVPPRPMPEEIPPAWEPPRRSIEEVFGKLEERYRELTESPVPEAVLREKTLEHPQPDMRAGFRRRFVPQKSRIPGKAAAIRPVLSFDGQSVVNGIIMSEILGQPVSLRKPDGLYW